MNGNEMLMSFINSLLRCIASKLPKIEIDRKKIRKEFDLDFFDDDLCFYTKILSRLKYGKELDKVFVNLKGASKILKRNLVIFLDYLKELIKTNKFYYLYKDPLVKIDISLILDYLVNKFGSNTVESIEFFPLCIRELEKKYKIKNMLFSTQYDIDLKAEAKEEMINLELNMKKNFATLLEYLIEYYLGEKNYNEKDLLKIEEISREYKENLDDKSLEELENGYLNNK